MAQNLVNREQVWTQKLDVEEVARDIAAGLEDSNHSEAGSDDGPEVQQLPDQVWEYPLTRKEQHLRLNKMQDMARLDAESTSLQNCRELRTEKGKRIWCEGEAKELKKRNEELMEEKARRYVAFAQMVKIVDQALATNPNVTAETMLAWAEIRKMGCPGEKAKSWRVNRKDATKTDRASSSTASTRASTSDDAHPELDDIEEEEEAEMDDVKTQALFVQRATALLETLDRQERLPAPPAAAAAAAAAAAPPAAAQQQPVLAIMEYPTIWSRTKGVLVDLFQPFETELNETE